MYLTQGLHRGLRQSPDAPAVIDPDGAVSFRGFADRVARLAAALRGGGVREGDRVGMLGRNSRRFIEYVFAVPWAGAVFNPVNIRWSVAEMAYGLNDSGTAVLLIDDEYLPLLDDLRERCPGLTTVIHVGDGTPPAGLLGYEELIAAYDPMPDTRTGGDALAGLLYTGGTTGEPKGVMVSHAGILTSSLGTLAVNGQNGDAGRVLHVSPLFHLAALGTLFTQAALGATHVTLPAFDPETLATTIEEHRVTDLTLVPTMIGRLVEHAERTGADLSSLRRIGYGASPIADSTLRKVMRLLPSVDLCQRYGMTELGPVATVLTPADHRSPGPDGRRLRSAGRAAPHAEVRVVGPSDEELPVGTVGEVVVRGGNVMLGYWNKPEATADALRGGWMHTGDAGYLDDDGYLFVVDRVKDMIVTGGENVYSVEVEKVLGGHPAVDACAVIGVPDDEWGERVHAVVVLRPGADAHPEELRAFCKESIAGYKAPRSVEFVAELPVSPVGKILKRRLRERHWPAVGRGVG